MNARRKVTIISVLTFGMVSVTVAILRLPISISVTSMETDVSVDVGKMIIVASFEVQYAIVAVNLPAMKTLWTKLREKTSKEGREEAYLRRPFMYSFLGKRRRRASMGSVTRLERGLDSIESRDEEEEEEAAPPPRRTTRMTRAQSIVVTTDGDVQHAPRLLSGDASDDICSR